MEITHVFYSHTEFLDILVISSDYSKYIDRKVLLINSNEIPKNISDNFDEIIIYDDSLPYTDKLASILPLIDSEYILFTHEVDIVLNYDKDIMVKLGDLMVYEGIDRIDLQPNGGNSGDYIEIVKDRTVDTWPKVSLKDLDDDKMYVCRHSDPTTYIYNVNPSIWRRDALVDIYTKFSGRTYRDIEYGDTQDYVNEKYLVYNLHSVNHKQHCGYLNSLPFYKYLHITHYRQLLKFDSSFRDQFGQSYIDASKEYTDMVNKYGLRLGSRIFT